MPTRTKTRTMPFHQRGPWTQCEDLTLLNLVAMLGTLNWIEVSEMMGNRSPKQCAERYHQNLRPGLDDSPLTEQERHLIAHLVLTKGTCWAHIARQLVNRSENKVKNWWYSVQAKLQRHERRARDRAAQSSRLARQQAKHIHFDEPSTLYATSAVAPFLWISWTPEDFEPQTFINLSQNDYINGPMQPQMTQPSSVASPDQPKSLNTHFYPSTGGLLGHNIEARYQSVREPRQDSLQPDWSLYSSRLNEHHNAQRKPSMASQSMPDLSWPPLGLKF